MITMFYHTIDPVLFRIGIFEVRYYGLIYALGFVIAYFFLVHLSKERKLPLTRDDISDYLFYMVMGVVLGARLAYVIFYNLPYYIDHTLEIFAVWKGGLSFHGGFIGAALACILYSKRKNIAFYDIADLTVIPLSLALMLGRIGNFLNGELVGRITSVPWAVKFQNYEGFRHPSQLYESLKNVVIFLVLWNV